MLSNTIKHSFLKKVQILKGPVISYLPGRMLMGYSQNLEVHCLHTEIQGMEAILPGFIVEQATEKQYL